jgi:hypothetical protein
MILCVISLLNMGSCGAQRLSSVARVERSGTRVNCSDSLYVNAERCRAAELASGPQSPTRRKKGSMNANLPPIAADGKAPSPDGGTRLRSTRLNDNERADVRIETP